MTTGNPIGHRETLEAYRLANAEGMGVLRPHAFQADVAWILECHAQVRMVHGRVGVRDDASLRDIYGPCDCIEVAVEAAIRLRDIYGIDNDSSLSVEVVVSLLPTAILPDTATKGSFGRTVHRLVPSDWRRGGTADAEKAIAFLHGAGSLDDDPRSPPIAFVDRIMERVAWTSTADEATNATSVDAVRKKFDVAIRAIDPAILTTSWKRHDA